MTDTVTAKRYDFTGALASAVLLGDWIPAHDETADIAETIGGFLGQFRDYVEHVRDTEHAEHALAELGAAIAEACGVAVNAPEYACAACGTTEAQTYVVTTLDPEDPIGTRTEVCLPCREAETAPEGLPALVYSDNATDSYLDHLASMRGWSVTVTTTEGDVCEGTITGAGYGADHMAILHVESEDGMTGWGFATENTRQVVIH
jgi:hypothetical protein